MKKAFVAAAGLMLIALPALSQGAADTESRDRSYDRRGGDALDELLRGVSDDTSGSRLSRGAGFVLRSGDSTVVVRCDARENMRACVEATTTLLERARSALQPAGAPGTPPSSR